MFLALILIPCAYPYLHTNWPFFDSVFSMLLMLVPVFVAVIIYLNTLREKKKEKLMDEKNSIQITFEEIEKNNKWCGEYIDQGTQPSFKFYNLTKIGIERCLNTLSFSKEEKEFLNAFYMTIKLVNIVNNIIEANIILSNYSKIDLIQQKKTISSKIHGTIHSQHNFNANLVNMAKESISESNKLKIFLEQRTRDNEKLISNS